jgi:nucleolin
MARNYTIAEAVQIITEGQDNEALMDLGKRYPLLTLKIAKVAEKAGEAFVDLMNFMPEHVSANKVNSAIKRMLEELPDADEDADEEEPKKKAPVKKSNGKAGRPKKVQDDEEEDDDDEQEAGSYDYDSMNNAKMYKLLGELGKRKDCKEKYGDLSHDSMLKYLKKYGPKSDASGEDDVEDEESGDEYEGKSAVELYKLCKSRKIKADQKKPAKYYIGLLKEADKEAEAEEDTDADDDEWDDDEEEEAPKKKAPAKKAPAKKAPAKKAKKEEPEEDEDDDDDEWEI